MRAAVYVGGAASEPRQVRQAREVAHLSSRHRRRALREFEQEFSRGAGAIGEIGSLGLFRQTIPPQGRHIYNTVAPQALRGGEGEIEDFFKS